MNTEKTPAPPAFDMKAPAPCSKNSAPNPNPKSFTAVQSPPQWGETTWLWPDFRINGTTQRG